MKERIIIELYTSIILDMRSAITNKTVKTQELSS
jgi:hypothetical protein